jgi:membrane protease YdiL (CAAX protease family)
MESNSSSMATAPPGWYADPWQQAHTRWWDGGQWTAYVAVAQPPERSWIPPRTSREHGLRGGRIALVGFVAAEAASLLAVLLVTLAGGSVHSLTALCAGQAALWACLFATCRLAVRRRGSGSLRELGLVGLSWRQTGVGLLVGTIARLGAGALALALFEVLSRPHLRSTAEPVIRLQHEPLEIVVVTFILVLGAPFFEELFFRGLVQATFTNQFGARVALFAQAACFGVVHYRVGMSAAEAIITIVTIGATGCLLGSLRWHYEKLGPGMVAHAIFNAFAVLVIVLV